MTVVEIINENYSELSKTQKRIADFVIQNTETMCFLSLKELAETIGTTEVTIINFCKKIGYDSFNSFKKDVQKYIQMVLSPSSKIVNAITDIEDKDKQLLEIIKSDLDALNSTLQGINIVDVKKSVEILKKATKIYVVGEDMSEVVADLLVLRIEMLGLDVEKFKLNSYDRMSIQMLGVKPTDVFIIISFPTYSKKPIVLSEYLREKGNQIICITDKTTSPVAIRSKIIFTCATETPIFYNSMTSPISLSNILVSALALEMKEVAIRNKDCINEVEEYFREILRELII